MWNKIEIKQSRHSSLSSVNPKTKVQKGIFSFLCQHVSDFNTLEELWGGKTPCRKAAVPILLALSHVNGKCAPR